MTVTITYGLTNTVVVDDSNDFFGTVSDIFSDGNDGFLNIVDAFGATDGQFIDGSATQTAGFFTVPGGNGAAARLSTGNYVVATQDADSIQFSIYNASGGTVLAPVDIADTPSSNADVTALAGGGFVIVSQDLFTGPEHDLDVRIYNSAGAIVSNTVISTSTAFDDVNASVATLDNGNFVVVWQRNVVSTGESEIVYQIRNPAGGIVVAETVLDTFGTINRNPSVTATATGFAVAYEDNGWDGEVDITVATVSSAGVFGSYYQISSGAEGNPYITRLDSGVLAVGLENYDFGASDTDPQVWFVDTATGNISSAGLVSGSGSVLDDQEDIAIAGNGNSLAISMSNLSDGTTDGQISEVIRYIQGDAADDIITAADSNFDNVYQGNDGNDTITAGSGNDDIYGGNGDDIISGGDGIDAMYGGDGDDSLSISFGGVGHIADGGAGTDTIDFSYSSGGWTIDLIAGTTLLGVTNYTTLISIENAVGSSGDDTISGDAFDNILSGGDGDDSLFGGGGTDTVNGGEGNDIITIASGDGLDNADGGNGVDTLDYSGTFGPIIFNMSSGSFDFAGVIRTATNFENFNGSDSADTITGTSEVNELHGGLGNDVIDGGNGADLVFGDGGDDFLVALSSGATLDGGDGIDTVNYAGIAGGSGISNYWSIGEGWHGNVGFSPTVLITFTAMENFIGLDSNDFARGTGGANLISGLNGNDQLRGFGGADTLIGGAGNDYLEGGAGAIDTMEGGLGDDIYVVLDALDTVSEVGGDGVDEVRTIVDFALGAGFENLRLQGAAVIGTGNDLDNLIIGGAAANTLDGGNGNDTVTGNSNNDTLLGGFGDDFLFGGQGNDIANGGANNDTLRGDDGSDTLNGDNGDDLLQGGLGIDTLNGGGGADILRGEEQNDILSGNAGADTLQGGDGNDSITGGLDRDVLTGGAGNDNFFWDDGDFAGLTNALADRVTDFVQGSDRIRLNLVDAITGGADNAFTFIGTGAFTGTAGQLRYSQVSGVTLITGDTNGDGAADIAIALTGIINLVAGDFVL